MIGCVDGHPFPDLVRLQTIQKAIAGLLVDFCEARGWSPFLACGSALGAVRGGDVIPWDDDVDIGMLRHDYEAFLEAYQRDPFPGTHLQCWRTEAGYPLAFARLRVEGTRIEQKSFAGLNFHQGIFVDILPYDSLPRSAIARQIQYALLVFIDVFVMSYNVARHNPSGTRAMRLAREIAYAIRPIVPLKLLIRFREWLSNPPGIGRCSLQVCFSMYGLRLAKRTYVEQSILLPTRAVRFGDRQMPIPGNFDAYLTGLFGAYMTPPPVDKRKPGHVLSVDFGADCPFG